MNKFVLALVSVLSSSVLLAGNVQPVPNDDTPYTAICVASLESEDALQAELQEHGITQSDIYDLSCNGYSLHRFAAKYQSQSEAYPAADLVFAARGTETDAVKLCIAAATSNQEFSRLKNELLNPSEQSSLYELECNGKSLHRFARSYGNIEFRI